MCVCVGVGSVCGEVGCVWWGVVVCSGVRCGVCDSFKTKLRYIYRLFVFNISRLFLILQQG